MMKKPKLMSKMEMDPEKFEEYKKSLEKEFYEVLEREGNVSYFLYFPYHHLTEGMKNHLDHILMDQAYEKIETGALTPDSFTVYVDPLITVTLEQRHKQIEILEKMIAHFEASEQYEKCSKIQELLNIIK
jgi:hypothetical protein